MSNGNEMLPMPAPQAPAKFPVTTVNPGKVSDPEPVKAPKTST